MSYQNVGTPRFYVDTPLFLKQAGYFTITGGIQQDSSEYIHSLYGLNPTSTLTGTFTGGVGYVFPNIPGDNKLYVAALGHRGLQWVSVKTANISGSPVNSDITNFVEVVNWSSPLLYDGFTIGTYESPEPSQSHYYIYPACYEYEGSSISIGALSAGTYYDMPHSPEMSLTMTREMDGVKRIRTKGGADLVNRKYTKTPAWGDAPAWELYNTNPPSPTLSRSGRRTWDLNFNYLQDTDVFPAISNMNYYLSEGWTQANSGSNTLLTSNNFYSQVIHRTNGGQLPFIFQPDNSNNSPDNFAICKFDMNEYKFEQVTNGVYNMKLKIREVW